MVGLNSGHPAGRLCCTNEIIELIIKPIGDPDRNLLLPLLLVSRRFYEITAPLLYESVSAAFPNSSYRPRPYDTPLTTVTPECFTRLHQSIIQNPPLATYISTLISHGRIHHSDQDWESFRSISSSAIHLRRLHVWASFDQSLSVKLLPPSVRLTHLFLKNAWDEATFDFIQSQPSLEYLTLGAIAYNMEEASSSFRGITLPNLKILDCDAYFFNKLEAPPLLKHLTLSYGVLEPPQFAPFRSIQSFMGYADLWRQCAPFCEVVEYVWVLSMHDSFIEDTLSVSSRQIKYLYHVPIDIDDVDCSVLFAAFPDLAVVDLDGAELGGFRYRRGCPEAEEIDIVRFDKVDFRHWCELVVDVVEEETRKNENGRTP
ncbi:hypothetical protein ONZ45_g9745 [Pleurotus djamor]|nr:hypothetical protein ONZ45_g9745 [Pleurotus djamor]